MPKRKSSRAIRCPAPAVGSVCEARKVHFALGMNGDDKLLDGLHPIER
jgi:hypothetical protein